MGLQPQISGGTREDPNKEQLYTIIYCPTWLADGTFHEYTFTAPA